VSEPARSDERILDVRVGSATNALQPVLAAERTFAAGPAQWLSLLLVAAAAVAADQVTKQLVARTLALGDSVELAGPFSIHHVHNSGIAFGCLVLFFARSGRRHPLLPVALGLVLGGSVSNLLDRVRLGYVTDFLDLAYWPSFNLADTFIVVGVGLLFLSFVAADRSSPRLGTLPLSRS
jgi:signal peptidase II